MSFHGFTAIFRVQCFVQGFKPHPVGAALFFYAGLHHADQAAMLKTRSVDPIFKPAHTRYDLCLVEPRFRVGLQSTVGLDTIIEQRVGKKAMGFKAEIKAKSDRDLQAVLDHVPAFDGQHSGDLAFG